MIFIYNKLLQNSCIQRGCVPWLFNHTRQRFFVSPQLIFNLWKYILFFLLCKIFKSDIFVISIITYFKWTVKMTNKHHKCLNQSYILLYSTQFAFCIINLFIYSFTQFKITCKYFDSSLIELYHKFVLKYNTKNRTQPYFHWIMPIL